MNRRKKRKLKRIQKIRRAGMILLCVVVVMAILTYVYRPDLIAWAGLGAEKPGNEEPAEEDPDPEPPSGQPSGEENPQLDAPEPDPENPQLDAPEPGTEPGPEPPALKVVADGNYLLALVTKATTLKKDYAPRDLVEIPSDIAIGKLYLRKDALDNLKVMWQAAKADGVTLKVRSAYRSYSTQVDLFNSYAKTDGEELANTYSARAGQSEHQLGTAVDFGGTEYDFKDAFGETPQGKWLAENAHLYGFAMSYPQGKQHVTGYKYEPWHFRYIGVEEAREWKESGLTLCEFLEQKTQYWEQ